MKKVRFENLRKKFLRLEKKPIWSSYASGNHKIKRDLDNIGYIHSNQIISLEKRYNFVKNTIIPSFKKYNDTDFYCKSCKQKNKSKITKLYFDQKDNFVLKKSIQKALNQSKKYKEIKCEYCCNLILVPNWYYKNIYRHKKLAKIFIKKADKYLRR